MGMGLNREEYMKFHREMCERMVVTTAKKNADYTGGSDDPFFNFTRVEAVGITETERGFLTRMFDKFARVTTFVNIGVLQVADESVEDTLIDLANYSILLAGYIRSKKQKHGPVALSVDAEAEYQRYKEKLSKGNGYKYEER